MIFDYKQDLHDCERLDGAPNMSKLEQKSFSYVTPNQTSNI